MPLKFGKREEKIKEIKETDTGEVRSWIRRLEQNIEGLDKRLDAVERRLSGEEFIQPKIGKPSAPSNEKISDKRLQEISRKMEDELQKIRDEMLQLKKINKNIIGEMEKDDRNKPLIVKGGKRNF